MSDFASTCSTCPRACSGGIYAGVPTTEPSIVISGESGVLSGVMRGADQIRNRPAVVDAPVGKGRVILYVDNPIYRWQTFGEHQLVFNALLYFNDMPSAVAPR